MPFYFSSTATASPVPTVWASSTEAHPSLSKPANCSPIANGAFVRRTVVVIQRFLLGHADLAMMAQFGEKTLR
jgi:hypothetical protein